MLFFALIVGSLFFAAYSDISKRKISNLNIFLIFFLGVVWILIEEINQLGILLLTGLIGFLIGLVFYRLNLMGAADVKLAAALGVVGGGWILAVSWLLSVPAVLAVGFYFGVVKKNSCNTKKNGEPRRIVPFGGIWIICFLVVWIYVKASVYDI